MDNSAIEKRAAFLRDLTLRAGELAKEYFGKLSELVVEYKSLQSAVSIADKKVEEFIRSEVKARFPEDFCFGEEFGLEAGKPDSLYWVIDPIDGTNNFLAGHIEWCVSIALSTRKEIYAGAVYNPITDEFFFARKGAGAFLNNNPIRVRQNLKFENTRFAVGYKPSVDKATYLEIIKKVIDLRGSIFYNGSGALMACYAALSRVGSFVELHINAWDCLAGILIADEAGCQINNFLDGEGFEKGNALLISAPSLWEQARQITEI